MSRLLCDCCQRPIKTCICQFIYKVNNCINVIILQHPTEVSQPKGSLTLLVKSLNQCTIIVGENFSENEELKQILVRYKEKAYLLYPHQQAQTLKKEINDEINFEATCLILIDATWKKAYRMFMFSENLHQLQKIQLPSGYTSLYKIRKTTIKNGLSTLEACCYALAILEKSETNYQPLIRNFKFFNDFLLSFRQKNKPH